MGIVGRTATDIDPRSELRSVGAAGPVQNGDRAAERPITVMIPNGPYQKALEAIGFQFEHYSDTTNVHVFAGSATADQIRRIHELDFVAYIEPEQRHTLAHDQSQMMIGADRVRGRRSPRRSPTTCPATAATATRAPRPCSCRCATGRSTRVPAGPIASSTCGFQRSPPPRRQRCRT